MNGIGLLVVLISVGADAGWEKNPNGTLSYTIRVDGDALPALVSGEQAFITDVEPDHRRFREFQLMLPETNSQTAGINRRSANNDDTIVLGWEPAENGGLKFYIQMSPERFETFSKGIPVRGRVPPEVTDVRQVLVFVGIKDLPKVLNPERATAQPVPPDFTGRNLFSAAQVSTEQNSVSAPRNNNSATFSASDTIRQPSLAAPVNPPKRVYSGQRQDPNDGQWESPRRQPNARDLSQPVRSVRDDRRDYDRTNTNQRQYDDPQYNDPQYNDPQYDDSQYERTPRYADPGYQPRQVEFVANQPRPDRGPARAPQRPATQQRYSNPQPTYSPQAAPSAHQFAAAAQPQPSAPAPTWPVANPAQTMVPPQATSVTTQAVEEDVRPWGPLILTTMALFTSLGANAYLGWLAWSFFWRFKDMASDVVRARSQSSASRQAA